MQVNVGMIGGGTVGGGVYRALQRNGSLMTARLGIRFKIGQVAVQNLKRTRAVKFPRAILTDDWRAVIANPSISIVAELMGGTTTARTVVLESLRAGKSVVTANKALISAHGPELFAAAKRHGANLYYEASVAGGIPIIKVLREGLIGNRIISLYGVVNGTCNYILTKMTAERTEFADALRDAQARGYAEAEPSLDVDGYDAAHKTGILASLAHGVWVKPNEVFVEGIRPITQVDIQFAERLGFAIKLLGIVKTRPHSRRANAHGIQVSVYPALVPKSHVIASVGGVYNAVLVRGDVSGDTVYCGRGAGADATASAVLSDLGDAALDLKFGSNGRIPPFVPNEDGNEVLPMDEVMNRYYLRLNVADQPGTLAKIAAILARTNIGISSVIQPEGHEGESVPLILMIHDASNAAMARAIRAIRKLSVVRGAPVMLRVEDFS
ncbi:MAG: homoserine dehydrogenase [Pedosphaera sp.]|nr:homoserine dehydrogenase [Pedosphaera sp.]